MGLTRACIAPLVGALVVFAVACAGPHVASSVPVGKRPNYVALGDSFAAAPGVPDQAPPAGCRRSTNDYPSVLARRLSTAAFVDVTCSGATTEDITSHAQRTKGGPIAPQIDMVNATTDLVTITVGANDVGLASDAEGCKAESADSPPCTDEFVDGNVDRISDALSAQWPVWSALVDRVRSKAPQARIVVVGYEMFVRPGGCYPGQPVLPRDSDYLQSKLNELDDLQQQLAAKKGIDYFDTRPISRGHDICASPSDRYIEGFETTGSAVPLHPNAFGAAAVGNALARYIAHSGMLS
jgi:lysophospholipase L1-like esterase